MFPLRLTAPEVGLSFGKVAAVQKSSSGDFQISNGQVRELEEEIEALASGRAHRRKLKELMNKKELVGDLFNNLRLARQRLVTSTAAGGGNTAAPREEASINATLAQLLMVMERLDAKIGAGPSPLCKPSVFLFLCAAVLKSIDFHLNEEEDTPCGYQWPGEKVVGCCVSCF